MAQTLSKRVLLDSVEIQDDEYKKQGIHYWFDEKNVTDGQFLIWGPEDSVYQDMPMVYSVNFANAGYPFDPPKVLFLTSDGYTRLHPNMYKEGKVCLSILGTWDGPKWAPTMRLSTIGLTIQSLMDNNPIVHEPGYAHKRDQITLSYNEYIRYKCLAFLIDMLEAYSITGKVPYLLENFTEEFNTRLPFMIERLHARLSLEMEEKTWAAIPYNMTGKTNYQKLQQILSSVTQKLGLVKS